jgi:flagellar assembly protein FliH
MKPWPETVQFQQPPREVGLSATWHIRDLDAHLELREKAAFDRGRIAGEKALSEQLMRQRGELIELQQGIFNSITQAMPQVARDCEQILVQLAIETAQKLVDNLPISAEMIEAAVREAMEQVEEETEFLVLLHPHDLALLHQINSPLLEPKEHNTQIRLKESHEVSRGGCLVHTRFGTIDARRETKVELIKQSLNV